MRQPKSPHRKTSTPIVAKQKTNDTENTIRKLAELTFLPLFTNLRKKIKKGIKPLIKIRRFPSNHYSFLFGKFIIPPFWGNVKIILRKTQKKDTQNGKSRGACLLFISEILQCKKNDGGCAENYSNVLELRVFFLVEEKCHRK